MDRRRAYMALVACALWVLGFEVLPWAHVALHARVGAHLHVDGRIVPIETKDCRYYADADGCSADAHDDDHDRGGDDVAQRARASRQARLQLADALAHGRGSVAHHDLAIRAPAVPLHAPLPITRRPLVVSSALPAALASASVPHAAARGPPARRAR